MDPITLALIMAAIGAGGGALLDEDKRGRGALIGGTLGGLGGYFGAPLLSGAGAGAGAGTEFGVLPLLSPTGATLSPEVFGAVPASAAFGPSVGGVGGGISLSDILRSGRRLAGNIDFGTSRLQPSRTDRTRHKRFSFSDQQPSTRASLPAAGSGDDRMLVEILRAMLKPQEPPAQLRPYNWYGRAGWP